MSRHFDKPPRESLLKALQGTFVSLGKPRFPSGKTSPEDREPTNEEVEQESQPGSNEEETPAD